MHLVRLHAGRGGAGRQAIKRAPTTKTSIACNGSAPAVQAAAPLCSAAVLPRLSTAPAHLQAGQVLHSRRQLRQVYVAEGQGDQPCQAAQHGCRQGWWREGQGGEGSQIGMRTRRLTAGWGGPRAPPQPPCLHQAAAAQRPCRSPDHAATGTGTPSTDTEIPSKLSTRKRVRRVSSLGSPSAGGKVSGAGAQVQSESCWVSTAWHAHREAAAGPGMAEGCEWSVHQQPSACPVTTLHHHHHHHHHHARPPSPGSSHLSSASEVRRVRHGSAAAMCAASNHDSACRGGGAVGGWHAHACARALQDCTASAACTAPT